MGGKRSAYQYNNVPCTDSIADNVRFSYSVLTLCDRNCDKVTCPPLLDTTSAANFWQNNK